MSTTIATTAAAVGQHWNDGPHDGGGFPFFIFPFLWLLVVGGIITAVAFGRRRRERDTGRRAGERALAEAYAAGQIDDQTYRTRRAVLREKE